MMTWLAIKAINFYQQFISPHKGFSCAHRVSTGEVSCSGYGKKVISRFGFLTGLKLLNRRFYDCGWHAKRLKVIAQAQNATRYKRVPMGYKLKQGGFVDCGGCDGCDVPHCDVPHCDLPDVGDCVPDCDCSPTKIISSMDFCDCLPDSCDGNEKRHTKKFKDKRDSRNQTMYGEQKGVSLDKE